MLKIIAIGTKMPTWVEIGYQEYCKRLPKGWHPELIEIPAIKRSNTLTATLIKQREGVHLLNACNKDYRIALDVQGESWPTETFAKKLAEFRQKEKNISLLIGGADGISHDCLNQCQAHWSLSPLTLPHPLVRIVVIEQIYRAWCILHNHPYPR